MSRCNGAVWKAWDTISRHKLEIKDPVGTAFDCLNRAAAVEDHVEALLARISAEHELSEDDIDARGGVRKGFQILRGAIKKNEPLE
jgi:hypothetical protein